MASTPEYLAHVLDLLGRVEGVTHRAMMGEYLLYARGTLFGESTTTGSCSRRPPPRPPP